jgi:hypothetical protein
MGMGPYPITLRRSVLSSPSLREGEEGVVDVEDVVEVVIAKEEDDDEPIEVIPMLESPPRRPTYKQMAHLDRLTGSTHRTPSAANRCKGGWSGLA